MPVITIREEGKTDTGFQATLKFDAGEYQITITDPFTPQEEKQLEWYFEEWLVYPMLDTVKAQDAATSVKTYGERLFEQVFQEHIKAYSEYDKLRSDLSQVQIEIVSKTPEFHALHWEAMRDRSLPRPLAVDCVMVRKSIKPASVSAYIQPSAIINLLVVIARPDEEQDVGYRTISRPLIELNTQLRVNVELLRPGTYEALSKHLEEKGAGYYHIIHFDCHGTVMAYEQVLKPSNPNRYFYKGRYGRGDLQKFEGVRAFLAFEGETQGKVDLVEASELAALLTGKGIPVCILNACQSGKQPLRGSQKSKGASALGGSADLKQLAFKSQKLEEGGKEEDTDYRETSLASRLMTAGMQMVVGMGYSVTVSAAKLMMEQVYTHLFNQKDITEAIRLGRRELFMQKERKAYFNNTIDLEDWLLPVVYSNQKVNLNLREFAPEEKQQYLLERSQRYRFPQPQYGFIGRDLDILKVEKSLLRHNILLLQGMGGTGKTTLLNYLQEWWQTTHFVEQVFYFGYDQKAWARAQILFEIAKQVYKQFELAQFQAMPPSAQMEGLVITLRAKPYALILDNFESVTGQKLAIKNTLSKPKRQEIKDFLERLVGGKTLVIVGSRSGEEWLQEQTFQTNIYQLQGLDKEARSDLAEKILQRNVQEDRIPTIRQDQDFLRLMQLLDGYPLAMEVTLANLKKQSPKEILAGLQLGDVNLDTGSGDKTKSILKCVEYSHSNLSPDTQKLLLCLAPFSGFIRRDTIPGYAEELQKLEPFKNYAFDKFNEAIQEAINWGLLSPIHPDSTLLTIQPVFPYFLKTKLEALDKATREALYEGFKNHYLGFAKSYKRLIDSKDAEERQSGIFLCEKEYENLYQALQICLYKHEDISIYFCLNQYFSLINDPQRNLELSESVNKALEQYPPAFLESTLGNQVTFALHRLANNYLDTKQYQLAKQSYQKTLEFYQRLSAVEERTKQLWSAAIYHNLGMVAQKLREFEEARRNYQLALEIYIEFSDRYGSASTYHQLGRVAQELREFAEARRNFQQTLEINIEFSDRYNSAKPYHQLGRVAEELREFAEARRNYQQALEIYIEFSDRYGSASTYHQLGRVAQELREFAEARRNYQLALEIYIEFSDRYGSAKTYHQLGRVAQELREFAEARRNFQQTLEIDIEFGDRYGSAGTYHQLGFVAQELWEFEEARRNYQLALQIYIEFSDHYGSAKTYHNLGMVAQDMREFAEARRNYQQALEINIEFSDRYNSAKPYHQLGRVAEELREFAEARRNYQQALEIYIEFSDRYGSASTYHQLGWVAQELREFAEARRNYQQALEIYIEFSDRYGSASTYHQLGWVAQEMREFAEARRNYQLALEIYIEFSDRYRSASTYHQLGRVAQELRELEEARRNYQLALEIKLEFSDRYGSAKTYHGLGLLAEAQENYAEARANLHKALEIYVEYKDDYWAASAREVLERLPE